MLIKIYLILGLIWAIYSLYKQGLLTAKPKDWKTIGKEAASNILGFPYYLFMFLKNKGIIK